MYINLLYSVINSYYLNFHLCILGALKFIVIYLPVIYHVQTFINNKYLFIVIYSVS